MEQNAGKFLKRVVLYFPKNDAKKEQQIMEYCQNNNLEVIYKFVEEIIFLKKQLQKDQIFVL